MRVSGSAIQSSITNGVQGRDDNRLQQQAVERARDQSQKPAQPQQDEVQISEAARQAVSNQQIASVNRSEAGQPRYQYYQSIEQSTLPSSNQRALQAYTTTQQISREAQGSGEFLGSIDLFV